MIFNKEASRGFTTHDTMWRLGIQLGKNHWGHFARNPTENWQKGSEMDNSSNYSPNEYSPQSNPNQLCQDSSLPPCPHGPYNHRRRPCTSLQRNPNFPLYTNNGIWIRSENTLSGFQIALSKLWQRRTTDSASQRNSRRPMAQSSSTMS